MRLGIDLTNICEFCQQPVGGTQSAGEIALFGAVKYGWCPICFQAVFPPYSTSYKRRWIQAINKGHEGAVGHFDAGNRWLGEGNFERATSAFTKAIAIDPRFGAAYFARAFAWRRLGRDSDAMNDFDRWRSLTIR